MLASSVGSFKHDDLLFTIQSLADCPSISRLRYRHTASLDLPPNEGGIAVTMSCQRVRHSQIIAVPRWC